MTPSSLVKRILVTEKATLLAESNKYVLLVAEKATKNEIKKAVKELYNVDALSVSTLRQQPKKRRFRAKISMKQEPKKAIITLKNGQKIEV